MRKHKIKGGVFINTGYTIESALDFFLANSTYQVLHNTKFVTDSRETHLITNNGGLMIKLFLNDGIESPYSMSRSNFYEDHVTEILIKIVFLSDTQTPFRINGYGRVQIVNIYSSTSQEFQSEVGTQIDIFKQSLNRQHILTHRHPDGREIVLSGFEPICPTILYCQEGVSSAGFIQGFLGRPKDFISEDIIKRLRDNTAMHPNLGIVAMECLTGSRSLDDYMNDLSITVHDKFIAKNMAFYEIMRLYKLGYIHGDIHMNNILITPEYNYFYNGYQGIRGRVHLIDFGSTFLHQTHIPQTSSNYYQDFIMPSITTTSPRFIRDGHPDTLASTHPSYLWLQSHDPREIHLINLEINKLDSFRHSALETWVEHYQGARLSGHVLPGSIPYTTFHGGNPKNIFDELDPEYKLNEKYIEEYIKKEIKFQKEILHSLTPLKNSIRTRINSSTKLQVTDLNKAPLWGADSNLHRYKSKEYSLKSFGHKLLKTINVLPSHRTSFISGPTQRNQGGKTKRKTKRK